MNIYIYCILIVLCVLTSARAGDAPGEEFERLNQSRNLRKSMLEYLKAENVAREDVDGQLKVVASASEAARLAIDAENSERGRQFAILAAVQNKPAGEIAREFAKKLGVDVDAPRVALRVHGSNTIGAKLLPALLEKFLLSKGAVIERSDKDGVETRIYYRMGGGKGQPLEVMEIGAYGSETAFGATEKHKDVGLKGKFCDIGMASRPIKDGEAESLLADGLGDLRSLACAFPIALDGVAVVVNPANAAVQQLGVEQISRVFAGEIKDWSELGGAPGPIAIYARDDQSGTFDSFKSRVLKPYNRVLAASAIRFEDSQELVRRLAADPRGIGFIGLPQVDSTVSLVAVQDGAEARALSATRLTVKSLDYPLSRLLYLYAPAERSALASEFLAYCLGNDGQRVVDEAGFVGQGMATESDKRDADAQKEKLLADPAVPATYKQMITEHNRAETTSNIRFESKRMVPDINSSINIRRLATRLAGAGAAPGEILLIGFADNVGADAANLKLSRQRAEMVAQALERLGLKGTRVEAMGESMTVADNATDEGKSANRRVEVWIKP